MPEKVPSVFINESGDFGPYEAHSPYYIVAIVLHDQATDISGDIARFNERLQNLATRSTPYIPGRSSGERPSMRTI